MADCGMGCGEDKRTQMLEVFGVRTVLSPFCFAARDTMISFGAERVPQPMESRREDTFSFVCVLRSIRPAVAAAADFPIMDHDSVKLVLFELRLRGPSRLPACCPCPPVASLCIRHPPSMHVMVALVSLSRSMWWGIKEVSLVCVLSDWAIGRRDTK